MIFRKLELITPTGDVINISLPDFKGYSHVESEEEFIETLKKYSKGLKGLRNRKPELSMGKNKNFETLDEQMHCLTNARKYVDGNFVKIDSLLVSQKFTMDLAKGTCTIYGVSDEEVGTLYLDAIFDNWKELFHPDLYPVVKAEVFALGAIEEEPCEEHDEDDEEDLALDTVRLLEDHRKKLNDEIDDDQAMELWNYCMNLDLEHGSENMTYTIEYSGGGDSGQTDDVTVKNSEGETADLIQSRLRTSDEFDTLVWQLIQHHEGGFYNDEGGRGTIEFSMTHFQWNHFNYYQDENQTIGWNVGAPKTEEEVE